MGECVAREVLHRVGDNNYYHSHDLWRFHSALCLSSNSAHKRTQWDPLPSGPMQVSISARPNEGAGCDRSFADFTPANPDHRPQWARLAFYRWRVCFSEQGADFPRPHGRIQFGGTGPTAQLALKPT